MLKNICIIGAGSSGLAALKSCQEEGLHPICFEKQENIGGLWNRTDGSDIKKPSVYNSYISIASKECFCFSDFPFPRKYPPYINRRLFHQYLLSYAESFGLKKYIRLNTEVLNVEQQKNDDDREFRRWLVTTRNICTGETTSRKFDKVIACVGKVGIPVIPSYIGLNDNTFQGEFIHSSQYDGIKDLQGKKILVIGCGNSGIDIAVDVSRVAAQTSLSSRSGSWLHPRILKSGLPSDLTSSSRFFNNITGYLPDWIRRLLLEYMYPPYNHRPLGIESRYNPLNPSATVAVSDELPSRIVSGNVRIKPEVLCFERNEVQYVDESKENIDVVISCTGYTADTSCFTVDVIPHKYKDMRLYMWMFPVNIVDPGSLALLGILPDSREPALPIIELQSRYIAQVMSGRQCLPTVKEMLSFKENFTCNSNVFRFRMANGREYSNQLADLIGVYPSFWKLFHKDPKLAFAVHFGPILPYHYRLLGPHTWEEARNRILAATENTMYLLRGSVSNRVLSHQ